MRKTISVKIFGPLSTPGDRPGRQVLFTHKIGLCSRQTQLRGDTAP